MDFDDEEEEETIDEAEAHKHFAVTLYNLVWDLLEKPDRTADENELMVHAAHSSAFHWSQVGTAVNFQRSEWQLARVYIVLQDKDRAMHYARRCYNLTQEHRLIDFDLAFSYEAMARAYALNGQKNEYEQYKVLALKSVDQIEDQDDKDVFLKDLNSGPWFGMS